MPDNLFENAFPGKPFKPDSKVWNAILDAVRYVLKEQQRGKTEPPLTYKYFRITEVTAFGPEDGRAQWIYTADEVLPTKFDSASPNLDRYKPKVGGLVDQLLYNDAEERDPYYSGNTFTVGADDAYGNGVLTSDLPEDMYVTNIPVGRVVRAWYTPVAGGAEWRFDSANGITGDCEEQS